MIGDTTMTARLACWCGNAAWVAFSPAYVRCSACDTLVSSAMPESGIADDPDGECVLPGRPAGSGYREEDRERLPRRVRSDLAEPCLHGLRTLLAHKFPPARVLALGSAHGNFAGILRRAGFEVTGLETGPAVPQDLEASSFDAIALMNVLGHLSDPARAMRHSLDLLKPGGIVLIQTPRDPACASHDEFSGADRALPWIPEPRENRYVFSQRSLRYFFHRLGAYHLAFEATPFSPYEMVAVASRVPLDRQAPASQRRALTSGPGAWIVQALLDQAGGLDTEREHRAAAEEDRGRRLLVIKEQEERLGALEAEAHDLRAEMVAARTHLAALHEQIRVLLTQLRSAQVMVQIVLGTRTYRVLRALGRWKFIERALDEPSAGESGH